MEYCTMTYANSWKLKEAYHKLVMHNPKYLTKEGLESAERHMHSAMKSDRHGARHFAEPLERIQRARLGQSVSTKHTLSPGDKYIHMGTVSNHNPRYIHHPTWMQQEKHGIY